MKIAVSLTPEELASMTITQTQLQTLILERLDSTSRKNQKIFHQVELEVELKVGRPVPRKNQNVKPTLREWLERHASDNEMPLAGTGNLEEFKERIQQNQNKPKIK